MTTLLLAASPGFASGARVQVDVRGCDVALGAERLQTAIGVELRNLDPELVEYIESSHPQVSITCDNADLIDLRVTTDQGEALREILDAREAGTARFIAIAIAESLAAQASGPKPEPAAPVPAPEPETPPPKPPPPAPPRLAPMIHYPSWWWRAAGGGRLFGDPGLPSFEGRVGVERMSSEQWSLSLDVSGTRGTTLVTSGELSAVTFSTGVALHRRLTGGRFVALPGIGARAGMLRWHGSPSNRTTTQGRTGFGPWAGPFVDLGLGLMITRRTRIDFLAEGGFTPMQVKATENSNVVGSIGELWLSLQLGLAGRL